MTRAPRIEFEGAVFHVVRHSNHGQKALRNDRDRVVVLNPLEVQTMIPGIQWILPITLLNFGCLKSRKAK